MWYCVDKLSGKKLSSGCRRWLKKVPCLIEIANLYSCYLTRCQATIVTSSRRGCVQDHPLIIHAKRTLFRWAASECYPRLTHMGFVKKNTMKHILLCRDDISNVNLKDCHLIEKEAINWWCLATVTGFLRGSGLASYWVVVRCENQFSTPSLICAGTLRFIWSLFWCLRCGSLWFCPSWNVLNCFQHPIFFYLLLDL